VKDIQVLDPCEIPPIRTEFIEALGQGAFGKVHKAKLKDGLEYFKVEHVWVNTTTEKQKIVAVKELYGEFKLLKPRAYKQTRTLTLVQGGSMDSSPPRSLGLCFVATFRKDFTLSR